MEEQGPRTPAAQAVLAMKYLQRGETWRDACNRVAWPLADGPDHYHRFRRLMIERKFLPGGRIMAGTGTSKNTTLLNCYVSGTIKDSFVSGPGNIMERAAEAAATMRMGGGIGFDFSTLRPRGDLIKGLQSHSSGPISFMGIFNEIGLCTASSGHRRGAQMGVLRVDHPDIEEFICCKHNSHKLNGFNISVGVTDEFTEAVRTDSEFTLRFNDTPYKSIRARDLWEKIMRSTWDWAEPGVLFIDRMNALNNLSYCETISTVNPCFPGHTEVWTDKGPRRFDDLAKSGRTVRVLTQLDDGRLVYRDMVNPRLTRRQAQLVEVELRGSGRHKQNSYTRVRCTPCHKFFLKNGERRRADELKPGDRIASVYRAAANQKGYFRLFGTHETPLEHHVAAEYHAGRRPDWPREHGHHADENKSNNSVDNIEIRSGSWHNSFHLSGDRNPSVRFPEKNHFRYRNNAGENNGRYRRDINDELIHHLRDGGMGYSAIAKQVGCSKYTVMKRLGWERPSPNHTVVGVTSIEEQEDVYCGTVPSTGKFFVCSGKDEAVLVSNCAEQPLPPFGACLLGSVNLTQYLTPIPGPHGPGKPRYQFDSGALKTDLPVIVRALDRVIDVAAYPLQEQHKEATDKRRMGIGITGLANTLAALNLQYGSDEAVYWTQNVLMLIANMAYAASAELAAERGAFPLYQQEPYLDAPFIQKLCPAVRDLIAAGGIRNSHLTSIAPTGTISFCADNVSSGIEPVFSHREERIVNTPDGPETFQVEDYAYRFLGVECPTANDLGPQDHVNMLCAAAQWVDSSVSKTVNTPNTLPWDRFKDIYAQVYNAGGKSCATFTMEGNRASIRSEIKDCSEGVCAVGEAA